MLSRNDRFMPVAAIIEWAAESHQTLESERFARNLPNEMMSPAANQVQGVDTRLCEYCLGSQANRFLQQERSLRLEKGFSGIIEVDVLYVKIGQKRFAIP